MLKITEELSISGLNRDLATLAYNKLRKSFQATTLRLEKTLFLAVEKLMEQRLAGSIPKEDSENTEGLLIKGAGANTVTNSKATNVITNSIKEKGIREKSIIASKASKEKRDTSIKK